LIEAGMPHYRIGKVIWFDPGVVRDWILQHEQKRGTTKARKSRKAARVKEMVAE
jgi:hypothetical protein